MRVKNVFYPLFSFQLNGGRSGIILFYLEKKRKCSLLVAFNLFVFFILLFS